MQTLQIPLSLVVIIQVRILYRYYHAMIIISSRRALSVRARDAVVACTSCPETVATVTMDYGITMYNTAKCCRKIDFSSSRPPSHTHTHTCIAVYRDGALQKSRAPQPPIPFDQWQRGVFPKSLYEPSVVKLAAEQQAHRRSERSVL